MPRKIKWEMNGDSHAVAYESPGHPYKDRPIAFVSVVEPGTMGGVMAAVGRYLEAYGTMNPEVREDRARRTDTEGGEDE